MADMVNLCPDCGFENSMTSERCSSCDRSLKESSGTIAVEDEALASKSGDSEIAAATASGVMSRYHDAYIVSRAATGIGGLIKGLGIVVGLLILIGSMVIAAEGPVPAAAATIVLVGIFSALVTGGLIYIFGVIVAAVGQLLKAQIDLAVTNSPFLNRDQMRRAMSLPS